MQDVSVVVFMLPVELDPPQPWVDPTLGCLQWKYRRSLQSGFCTIHHLQDIRCFVNQGFSHSCSNNLSHLRTSSVRQVAGSSFLSHHHFKCAAWCPRRTRPAMTVLEKPSQRRLWSTWPGVHPAFGEHTSRCGEQKASAWSIIIRESTARQRAGRWMSVTAWQAYVCHSRTYRKWQC